MCEAHSGVRRPHIGLMLKQCDTYYCYCHYAFYYSRSQSWWVKTPDNKPANNNRQKSPEILCSGMLGCRRKSIHHPDGIVLWSCSHVIYRDRARCCLRSTKVALKLLTPPPPPLPNEKRKIPSSNWGPIILRCSLWGWNPPSGPLHQAQPWTAPISVLGHSRPTFFLFPASSVFPLYFAMSRSFYFVQCPKHQGGGGVNNFRVTLVYVLGSKRLISSKRFSLKLSGIWCLTTYTRWLISISAHHNACFLSILTFSKKCVHEKYGKACWVACSWVLNNNVKATPSGGRAGNWIQRRDLCESSAAR